MAESQDSNLIEKAMKLLENKLGKQRVMQLQSITGSVH